MVVCAACVRCVCVCVKCVVGGAPFGAVALRRGGVCVCVCVCVVVVVGGYYNSRHSSHSRRDILPVIVGVIAGVSVAASGLIIGDITNVSAGMLE